MSITRLFQHRSPRIDAPLQTLQRLNVKYGHLKNVGFHFGFFFLDFYSCKYLTVSLFVEVKRRV